jgi:hypothetical protein
MCEPQATDMPIVARPPGPAGNTASRASDLDTVGAAQSEELLPSGGAARLDPAPAPHRVLALDSLHVLRTLRDHPRDAGPWGEPAFAREVDLVRRHLAPIRSRRGLAASFGREAFHARMDDQRFSPGVYRPVRIAYAVRWLELGDGVLRPGWTSLVTDPG